MKRFLAACLRRAGRLFQPFFNPDHDKVRESLSTIAASHKELTRQAKELREQRKALDRLSDTLAAAQQRSTAELSDQVGKLTVQMHKQRVEAGEFEDRIERLSRERLAELQSRFSGLEARVRRQVEFSSRVMRRAKPVPRFILDEQRVLGRLERIAAGRRPILVGPWTGEVGFELLYWAPFVRWFAHRYNIAPERLVVISRGGTSAWYSDVAAGYLDVFAFFTAAEFRAATELAKKQRRFRGFDRQLLRRAKESAALGASAILHPGLMYQLFMPYWRKDVSLRRVLELTHHRKLLPVDLPSVRERLPRRYTAVRFYFSDCFPDTPDNRGLVQQTLQSLAEREPVVMLTPNFRVDDHHDYRAADAGSIITIDDLMTSENNLAVQTAALSGASRFVGTYGGFAYLAPLLGVDALTFYSARNFYTHHLELAEQVFAQVGGGSLVVLDAADLDLVRAAVRPAAADRPFAVEA